jgi:hypothetical protein
MKRLFLLLAATALGSAILCAHPAELTPSTATYQTRQGMMSATGTRTLERAENGQWRLTSRARLMMMELVERSQFTLVDGQVRPSRYEYINPFSRKRSRDLRFDWATQQATETRSGHTFALAPATLDRLTIQLQSQLDLCAAPDQFERRTYAIADRRNIKHYVVEKVGAATLDTAVGKLQTIELKRYREGDPADATRIWVAPAWGCLMVRLEGEDDGESATLELTAASVDGLPVKGR